ncbi:MAG: BON domain-containing protein [Thermomicrobiales bacterium]
MAIMIRTDADIQRDVMEEFVWDPEVEVTDVGVEVDDGVVTLTGSVREYATKLAAERAAFRVAGIRAVANDVEVHTVWSDERTDTDVAKAAANVIQHNTTIPDDAIDIKVARNWVTLTGQVEWDHQRRAAEKAIKRIHGVSGVTNMISIKQPAASASDITEGIERALVRSAEVDADRITVSVDGGHVTLTGSVRSWLERQEAHEAAWKSRGVTAITNKIEIRAP